MNAQCLFVVDPHSDNSYQGGMAHLTSISLALPTAAARGFDEFNDNRIIIF